MDSYDNPLYDLTMLSIDYCKLVECPEDEPPSPVRTKPSEGVMEKILAYLAPICSTLKGLTRRRVEMALQGSWPKLWVQAPQKRGRQNWSDF